jgi:hypothetical protein
MVCGKQIKTSVRLVLSLPWKRDHVFEEGPHHTIACSRQISGNMSPFNRSKERVANHAFDLVAKAQGGRSEVASSRPGLCYFLFHNEAYH